MANFLSNIFRKRAEFKAAVKAVPPAVRNDAVVKEAIFKDRSRKRWKYILGFLMGSTTLSIALQLTPNLVSTPFSEHMAEKGYPTQLKDHFHSARIRVYDRSNILYPFHYAGMTTRIEWGEAIRDPDANIGLLDIAFEPVRIGAKVIDGYFQMLPGNKLDAWSISGSQDTKDRFCYIRPAGNFSLERYLSDFSGVRSKEFHFRNDHEALSKILYAYVMLHEARHCDQDKRVHASPLNESDSDLYAFKIMQAHGVDPDLLGEAHEIMTSLRTINSVIGGDTLHTTTFTLQRKTQTAMNAHNDAATFWRLRQILLDAYALNSAAFPEEMKAGGKFFALTHAMSQAGLFKDDKQLTLAAETFMSGLRYLDQVSGGGIIFKDFNTTKLDFNYFTQDYKPVPDKLNVPKAAPKRAA